MKGIFLNTLAHPRLDRARLHPSRRRVLAAPGFGTDANQRNFPDPLASPAHSLRPRPAPAPGSGRDESAVLFRRHNGDQILHQPPSIAAGFHYQANVIARCQALWPANGRHVRAGRWTKNQCFLSPNPAKHMDSRCRFGTSFCA